MFCSVSSALVAADGDLSFLNEQGDTSQMIVINFQRNSIHWKERNGDGPWQTTHDYRITHLDSSSAYARNERSTIIYLDEASSRENTYLLRNDLALLRAHGNIFQLDTPLVFYNTTGSNTYKYVLEPRLQKGSYYCSSTDDWQLLSDFQILAVRNEGASFNGTPVFSLEYKNSSGITQKLMVSTHWNKMVGANNEWFYRRN